MAQRRALAREATAAAESIDGPNPIIGFRRADLLDSVRAWSENFLYRIHDTTRLPAALHGELIDIYLPRLHQQVLLIAGDDDPITPLGNARITACLLRSVTARVVRGGGHLALLTRTDQLVPLVHQFFSKN